MARVFFAAAILLSAPIVAQTNGNPDTPVADPSVVDLSNFSLQGNVTRPAERSGQQPAAAAPAQRQPAPAASQPTTTSSQAPTTSSPSRVQPPPSSGLARDNLAAGQAQVTPAAPSRIPARTTGPESAASAPVRAPERAPVVLPPIEESGWSLLPFVAGILFAAGAFAIFYFARQRRQDRYAAAGGPAYDYQPVPQPEPARPLPSQQTVVDPAPAPSPRHNPTPRHDPTPREENVPPGRTPLPTTLMPRPKVESALEPQEAPASIGVVSTGLRPWIEVELVPDRALLDDDGAAIAFDVTLFNSGTAPARDVFIEACLLNAGAQQDQDLGKFFGRPRNENDTIPLIQPQTRVPLRTAVRLTRKEILEYEVEGRKLFMPLVAVSTRYRWSSGEGQTGVGFLIGRGQEEEAKLAPLRTDQGSRSWKGLGARRYEKGLRS